MWSASTLTRAYCSMTPSGFWIKRRWSSRRSGHFCPDERVRRSSLARPARTVWTSLAKTRNSSRILRAVAGDKASFDRKHGVKKAMRAGEHAGQKRDVFGARPGFALHAIDGSECVGAGEASCETELVEVQRCDAAGAFQIFDDAGEVDAIGVEQASDDFVDLRTLPRRPDCVGDEGERSAEERVEAARPDDVFRRDSGDGDH